MPKLNSIELKHKRKILNWAGENWSKIKEANKTRIWCALLAKEMPSKIEGKLEHEFSDRFFELAESELESYETRIFGKAKNGFHATEN